MQKPAVVVLCVFCRAKNGANLKLSGKAAVVALISAVTVSLGTAPALANTETYDFYANSSYTPTALTGQTLVTTDVDLTQQSIQAISEATAVESSAVTHGFDVDKTIALAKSEIGTSRPTGWNQPGECLVSAQRWIKHGGGAWTGSGNPVANYNGATRLTVKDALPGDIIQYEFVASPTSWVTGVHTMLVVGVNDDGTLHIIQSNSPGGSGLVSEVEHFTPDPPAGFHAVVWRF